MATVDQLSFDIPTVTDGSVRTIADVADVICGQHLLPHEQAETGMLYITGPADFTERVAVPSRHAAVEKALCWPGDVLLTVKGSGLGKVNLAPSSPAVIGRQLFAIRPHRQELDSTFLWRVLQHSLSNLRNEVASTTVPGIDRDTVRSLEIPVPALHEQRRIIARVEELAVRIEQARGLRRQAVQEVDAIVDSAANELLQTHPGSRLLKVDDVSDIRGGIQKGPHRVPGAHAVRYLTVAHVQRNHISSADPRYFEVSHQELDRWRLLAGDVLMVEGNGSATEIGRTALFRDEIEDCVHQNHVIRIRPHSEQVDPEFLNLYLNSPVGRAEVYSKSQSTSGLRTLSVNRIKQIAIPLPALSVQQEIVTHMNNVQTKVNMLRQIQADSAAELGALFPIMLERAFRGEL